MRCTAASITMWTKSLARRRSEKNVKVTVEACGEVRSFECRCATVSIGNGDGTGNACFVGSGGLVDLLMLTSACADTLYEAFRQTGAPDDIARKFMLLAVLGADPHGHADSVQTLDLDARREIRDMAAKLGVDADF